MYSNMHYPPFMHNNMQYYKYYMGAQAAAAATPPGFADGNAGWHAPPYGAPNTYSSGHEGDAQPPAQPSFFMPDPPAGFAPPDAKQQEFW